MSNLTNFLRVFGFASRASEEDATDRASVDDAADDRDETGAVGETDAEPTDVPPVHSDKD